MRHRRTIIAAAISTIFGWSGGAGAQQFVVNNGTTQTAPGPSYSSSNSVAALFAVNAGSVINGMNLLLTAGFPSVNGAFAQTGAQINLTGGSITSTASGASAVRASGGRFVGNALTITTGLNAAGGTVGGTAALPGSLVLSNSSIMTSGTGSLGVLASGAVSGQAAFQTADLNNVSVTTAGNGAIGLFAQNGTITANNVTVATSGGLNLTTTTRADGVQAAPGNAASLSGGQVTITGASSILTTGAGMSALNANGFFGATALGRAAISMTGGSIETGAAAGDAGLAQAGASLTLSGVSVLARNSGVSGLHATGVSTTSVASRITATNAAVTVTGAGSSALTADNGAQIDFTGGSLVASGTDSLALLANGGTINVTLNGGQMQGAAVTSSGGTSNIVLQSNTLWTLTGDSSVTTLALNQATVRYTGSFDLSGAITLGAGGGSFDTNGFDATMASAIDGAGALTKLGTGVLTLTGANTYSGGTTISAGTLQVGNGGTSGSILGNIANNAALVFNRSDAVSYDGVVSGTGTLTQAGTGTLTLTGANTYSGGTTVSGGTLIGNTTSLQGNIANGAALVFDQATDGVYVGAISGSGTLAKRGAGELLVSGTHSLTGMTTVESGVLRVNGALAGPVTVAGAGALGGTGSVGATVSAGRVAPGNSIGTLTVNGNYTHQAGSVLEIEATPNGASDLLRINGAAVLQGGFVNAVPLPGAYAPPLRYLILDATGGVTGTFDGLAQRRAFFTAGFDYQPNQVFLVFSPLPFNNPATCVSHNTCAVTAALDAATPSAGPGIVQLLQALAPLSDTEALAALNSFTGDMHPTLASLALEEQALLGQSITRRLGALRGRGGSGASAGPSMSPLLLAALDNTGERLAQMAAAASPTGESLPRQGAWGQVYGVDGKRDNDGNAAGADYRVWGTVVGMDRRTHDDWVTGAALNYSRTRLDGERGGDHGELSAYDLAAYASHASGSDHLDLMVAYGYLDNDIRRELSAGTINRTASASYHGNRIASFAEAGRLYDLANGLVAEALASVQYTWLRQDGFTEQGAGDLGLTAGAATSQSLRTGLGGRLSKGYSVEGVRVVPELRARWMYEFLDNFAQYNPAFIGAPGVPFNVRGAEVNRSSLALGAGVEIVHSRSLAFFVDFDSRFNSDMRSYSLTGGLRYSF